MKLTFSVALEELKKEEGFSGKVYKCPAGKNTIGFGRNLDDVGITKEEAEFLLKNDIMKCDKELSELIPFYNKLNPARQYVILSMCFNLGFAGLLKFKKMLKAIQEENFTKASTEMLDSKWAMQVKNRAIKLSYIMKSGEIVNDRY